MCPNCGQPALIALGDEKLCGKCWMFFRVDLTPLFDTRSTPADARPAFPATAAVKDFVFDIGTDEQTGNPTFASRTYCPRETVEATPFDPQDPHFKFAMKLHRKRFKNRRRYMYEKQKKAQDGIE